MTAIGRVKPMAKLRPEKPVNTGYLLVVMISFLERTACRYAKRLQLCRGAATALHAVEFATTFVFRHDRSKFSDMLLNTLYFAVFQQRAVP